LSLARIDSSWRDRSTSFNKNPGELFPGFFALEGSGMGTVDVAKSTFVDRPSGKGLRGKASTAGTSDDWSHARRESEKFDLTAHLPYVTYKSGMIGFLQERIES
jgi:hypothetical protein